MNHSTNGTGRIKRVLAPRTLDQHPPRLNKAGPTNGVGSSSLSPAKRPRPPTEVPPLGEPPARQCSKPQLYAFGDEQDDDEDDTPPLTKKTPPKLSVPKANNEKTDPPLTKKTPPKPKAAEVDDSEDDTPPPLPTKTLPKLIVPKADNEEADPPLPTNTTPKSNVAEVDDDEDDTPPLTKKTPKHSAPEADEEDVGERVLTIEESEAATEYPDGVDDVTEYPDEVEEEDHTGTDFAATGMVAKLWKDDCVRVPTALGAVCFDGSEMLVLAQLIYWFGKSKKNGSVRTRAKRGRYLWVAKTYAELSDETGLNPRQARHAVSKLVDRGVLVKRGGLFAGSRSNLLRINPAALEECLPPAEPPVADSHSPKKGRVK